MKQITAIILTLLATAAVSYSTERITNFASAKTVYDVKQVGDVIYVATSGGLYYYNVKTGYYNLRPTVETFPDPVIRTLTSDPSGNLWVGTDQGYLMRVDPQGNEFISRAYVAADWRILDMKVVGKYLVVASNKGVSLFDRKKFTVYKNAAKFKDFQSSQINVITTFKNRLHIGGVSGVAVLKGTLDEISQQNFYDPTIWEVDTSLKMTVSCLVEDGKLSWYDSPSAIYNGSRMIAHENCYHLYVEDDEDGEKNEEDNDSTETSVRIDTVCFDSKIVSLTVLSGSRCWIGLENDYYYYYEGTNFQKAIIDGPKFTAVKRIHVDRSGQLWAVPIPYNVEKFLLLPPEWLGINVLIGSEWHIRGPNIIPEMGHMGRGKTALGLLEAKDGSMWFGFEGGAIKRYDRNNLEWSHYCNWGKDFHDGAFVKAYGPCPEPDYGKCDAIAQDSAGYLWFSSWNNYSGCLICYKPDDVEDTSYTGLVGHYKRFPPNAFEGNEINISAIVADNSGNVIYGTDKGEVRVITHDGNPIEDSIRTVVSFGKELGLIKVFNMLVISDGSTLILTTDGVYRFDPENNRLTHLEDFEKNIKTMAVENDNIYWYASPGKGLTRFDLPNNTRKVIDKSHGLLSDDINDIFFDKQNGYVWVATDRGVSRVTLGYSTYQANVSNQQVFPNPFSLRRHKKVSFQNIPTDGRITIHALNGNVVGVAKQVSSGVEGAYYEWRPSSDIAPGTYFYAVRSIVDIKRSGKLLIVP